MTEDKCSALNLSLTSTWFCILVYLHIIATYLKIRMFLLILRLRSILNETYIFRASRQPCVEFSQEGIYLCCGRDALKLTLDMLSALAGALSAGALVLSPLNIMFLFQHFAAKATPNTVKGAQCNIFTGCKQTKKQSSWYRNGSFQELTWLLDAL